VRQEREIYINLLNYKLKPQRIKSQKLKEWAVYLAIAVLIIGLAGTVTFIKKNQLTHLQEANQKLQLQITQNQASSLSLDKQKKLNDEIKSRNKLVSQLENEKKNFRKVYADIGDRERPGILLTIITIEPGTIAFEGYADSQTKLVQFVDWLRKGVYYQEISEFDSKADETTGEVKFNITAGLGANTR
jgi:Tfp pilus assembly protein PilN